MKKSSNFAATIAAIESVTISGKTNLQFNLSNIVLDDAIVDNLPSFDKDGKETTTTSFSKGLRCALGLCMKSPIGKVLSAKTGGRPENYEGVTEVLIMMLTGANLSGKREEYEAGETNPDIPDQKYARSTYRTVIDKVTLNVDKELVPFIMEALKNVKPKEAVMPVNPFEI